MAKETRQQIIENTRKKIASKYAKQLEQQLNKDYGISPKHYGIQLQNKHRKKK